MNTDLYERALKIAARAHAGQTRKHDDTPYIHHPVMVARLLEQHGFSEVTVAAGLVHDVLEDSEYTAEELRMELGDEVVRIVEAVSEDKSLDWEERKAAYVEKVKSAGPDAWALSVADKIQNARDFIAYHRLAGPVAWTIFNRGKEKKLWFEHLVFTELSLLWQHPLLSEYQALIVELERLPD